jgi:antitoxin ParD1/3/4
MLPSIDFFWQELTVYAIWFRVTMGGFAMNMTSMNISLPEPLKLFVEEQVNKGGYSTASEYLRELIREAQRRKEHQEIEAKLLAGLQSPTSEMTADEWTTLRERILSRSPELRGEG